MTSASTIAEDVIEGRRSAVEVVTDALAAVAARNGELNAIVTANPDARRRRAPSTRVATGDSVGPLCGVPVGIKDITPVAGLRTTYGSAIHADHIAGSDAVLVQQRLRAAGAIIIGKTNVPEFAAGANTWNTVFGATRNPWNPELTSGGSTGGGAAALAAGMVALADGTDLGGSLRIPAAFCGVVGLRPSPGLVPQHPVDWVWDTLSVAGPMARSVDDVARMLQVIAGPSPAAPLGAGSRGRDFVAAAGARPAPGACVAYCADIADIGVDASIEAACRTAAFALASEAADVREIACDLSGYRDTFLTLRAEWFLAAMASRMDRIDDFGVNVRANVEAGLALDPRALGAAHQARGALWQTMRELLSKVDYLVTPTTAVPPFPVEQNYPTEVGGRPMRTYVDWFAPTFLLSLAGLPIASVPCGVDAGGLPVGLQIVGRPHDEEAVLTLAAAVERLRPAPMQRKTAGRA